MTRLRRRWKRLRVWMFLLTASVEKRRKLCAAMAVATFVAWIAKGHGDQAQQVKRAPFIADAIRAEPGMDLEVRRAMDFAAAVAEQKADEALHLDSTMQERRHKHVGKGFYRRGFDVVGGARVISPAALATLREADAGRAGSDGRPVNLSREEEARGSAAVQNWGFNIVASNKVSLHRRVPDERSPDCRGVEYDLSSLPNASVVIAFHEEPWSTLMRTVWSVIHTVPDRILHEILLVDDASMRPHLRAKLHKYVRRYMPDKVRHRRLPERLGQTGARLVGARLATGAAVVFLDAHDECAEGWLQPLLEEIKDEPNTAVAPRIDVIDTSTMEYKPTKQLLVGGFSWTGMIKYHPISSQKFTTEAIASPVLSSSVFAMNRLSFLRMGALDDGMIDTGGENLELSWRLWMCGGAVSTASCSRVGHMFKPPRSFGNKAPHEVVRSNTERAILVWAEEYKWLFQLYSDMGLSGNNELEQKSLESRVRLKKKLECKDFHWYLQNVFASPMLVVPTDERAVAHFGRVRNAATGLCLVGERRTSGAYSLGRHRCITDLQLGAEYLYLTRSGQLRIDDLCASVDNTDDPSPVMLRSCTLTDSRQLWQYNDGRLVHVESGKCVDLNVGMSANARTAHVTTCLANAEHQKWTFETWHPPPRQ